jgi:lipoate---protein ligase
MLYIDNQNIYDPRMNLAIEEYALYHLDPEETYLLFYSMDPAIIVGKNQNTFDEINFEYVEKNHVYVVRRLSGGGAVYNDRGDLSFSFITKKGANHFNDYKKFTDPVVKALHGLGVDAVLSGRNDILVGARKISGNAQFSTQRRMISHGTLMFDVNLDNVESALRVRQDKLASKGVKSVRSRVTNIRDHLKVDMSIDEFKQALLQSIFAEFSEIPEYRLTETDFVKITEISESRYQNWDWNYGLSPEFNVVRNQRFAGGLIDVRLFVQNGLIQECRIYGDFFGAKDVHDLESRLISCPYEREHIRSVFQGIDVSQYFSSISDEDFLPLLYP